MKKNKYTQLIHSLSDKVLIQNLYYTQLLFLFVSLILGFFIFRMRIGDWKGLFIHQSVDYLIGFVAGLVVVLIDILFMYSIPASYHDDGGLNKRIFSKRHPVHIAIIAMVVACCEELLFRGVLQTNIGLVFSWVIFALLHYRYLFNPFLFINVMVISLGMGLLFEWTENLWVTIIMHFVIDFFLGCIIRFRLFQK